MIHEGTVNAHPALIDSAEDGKVARVALLPRSYYLRRTADGQIAGVVNTEKKQPQRFDPLWNEPDPFDAIQITRNTLRQTSFLDEGR
jgi:hypothetical protein